jgi:hypothetical protein
MEELTFVRIMRINTRSSNYIKEGKIRIGDKKVLHTRAPDLLNLFAEHVLSVMFCFYESTKF